MQSVSITTKVVRSNPAHGKVYLIQHYVIKFVSDLRQVNITEILLKVGLNTMTLISLPNTVRLQQDYVRFAANMTKGKYRTVYYSFFV